MLSLAPEVVERRARDMKIVQHSGGRTDKWVPTQEQGTIWRALVRFALVYILKGRQIGSTTAVIFWLLQMIDLNDRTGHPVRVATVIDTDAKASERFRVAKSFCRQLRLRVKPNEAQLILLFPGGSEYVFMSAGSRRAGASGSFHMLHLTEVPFWRDVQGTMAALMQALVGGGRVIMETTMGVGDMTAKKMWTERNGYRKIFFTYEEHEEYRRQYDPRILSVDLEARLVRDGFTNRESMTDWAWRMRNMCGGDYVRCMREYPNKPEHSWAMAEGRWVTRTPGVLEPLQVIPVESPSETGLQWEIFRRPADGSGHYLVVCDPAGGMDRDASSVHVLDRRDRRVCASFNSASVKFDDLCEAICAMQTSFCVRLADGTVARPRVAVESNGLGRGVLQHLARLGCDPEEIHSDKVSRLEAMTLSKRYVEAGVCYGPQRLADECDGCHVEDGAFVGPKDALMALGMGLKWIATNPIDEVAAGPTGERYERR